MSENTSIEWADHTFNPWVGCTKVSPACDHCYAEGWAKRAGTPELWAGERRRTIESNWKQPHKWNRNHDDFFSKDERRQRVFCASLADIFDNQVPQEWRNDFWQLVRDTPNLDWLLLTKRPQNIAAMLPKDWGCGYPNVWLGATMENQKMAEKRSKELLAVPAIVHFVSSEPLLGDINFDFTVQFEHPDNEGYGVEAIKGLDWIITGGESGSNARPTHPDWFRSIRDQCQVAGVAFHFKQWGEWAPIHELRCNEPGIKGKQWFNFDPDTSVCRIGKGKAGRVLDGRTWDEFPG